MPRIPAEPKPGGRTVLKAAGLVAVAVVAGLVWYLAHPRPASSVPVAQTPVKEFEYTATVSPVVTTDCAGGSTDQVKTWFAAHPCQKMSRALYSTSYGSAQALVSVAVVTMPSASDAQALKQLVDTDGTGNVRDLVADGTAKLPGSPKLAGGQYASRISAGQVTIVLAEFYAGHKDPVVLKKIATDALDLGPQVGG